MTCGALSTWSNPTGESLKALQTQLGTPIRG